MKSRTVNPLSLMTDVFVLFERLKVSLEETRDELVHNDRQIPDGLRESIYNCGKLLEELRGVKSLCHLGEWSDRPKPPKKPDPEPPGPPDLKIVS